MRNSTRCTVPTRLAAPLERAEERALVRRHLRGDARARERLLGAHLDEVQALARRYQGYGVAQAELVAAGNLGLVRALARFDPQRGTRFMTYAVYFVRAEMLAEVCRSWSIVGIGRSSLAVRLFFGLRREEARLEYVAQVDLTPEQRDLALARHFSCTVARVQSMRARIRGRDRALDPEDERAAAGDPERALLDAHERAQTRSRLREALSALEPRERLIFERRTLAEPRPSCAELGHELGLSRERVRQLEHRAQAKLRTRLEDDGVGSWRSAWSCTSDGSGWGLAP